MQRSRTAPAAPRRTARRRKAPLCFRGLLTGLLPLWVAALPLGAGPASARPPAERLVILPLEQEVGQDAEHLRPVEDAFRAAVEGLERYRVSRREEATLLLDSVRSLGLDCQPGDLACLTKAGVVMEIDLIAVLRATAGQERVIVSAVLVDVENGRMRASVNRSLAPGDSLPSVMRSAAVELLAPDLFVGSLELDVSEPGAAVRVDGMARGTTPLPGAIEGLAPGEHLVVVEKRGFDAVEQIVDVRPLASRSLVVELRPVGSDDEGERVAAVFEAPPAAPEDTPPSGVTEPLPMASSVDEEPPRALPLLPVALSGVAALSALTASGAGIAALVMSARRDDQSLSLAEREGARDVGQVLLVVGATGSALAVVTALGASAGWLFP